MLKQMYEKIKAWFQHSLTLFLATAGTIGGLLFSFGGQVIDAFPILMTPDVAAYLKSFIPSSYVPAAIAGTSFVMGLARLRSIILGK